MEFESILFAEKIEKYTETEPSFFADLQLHYLFDMIRMQVAGYELRPLYYTFPVSRETIGLRHAVFAELERDPALVDLVTTFCFWQQKARSTEYLSTQSEEEIHRASFHLKAAQYYLTGLLTLADGLRERTLDTEIWKSFLSYVENVKVRCERSGLIERQRSVLECFERVRFQMVVRKNDITITEEPEDKNYLAELAALLHAPVGARSDVLENVFSNPLAPSYLERSVAAILRRSDPRVYQELTAFLQEFPILFDERLLTFEQEVQFYLSFLSFKRETKKLGYELHFPVFQDADVFHGTEVYDLSLAWKHRDEDMRVVANDVSFDENPSFLIVTGPNQGGKTTFARALGQSVYFAMMGLFVNAKNLTIPYLTGLATHFENEENTQSNAGKLKDEINRLIPMVKGKKERQLVILNELFTTATTNDARTMGREVVDLFLERHCYGVYVTHIEELAKARDGIISLVAQVEPGEAHKRTYRILPMNAAGEGFSETLVEGFALTYEDLMRRLP